MNAGPSRAIYLEEIPVAGLTLNDLESLKERVYNLMETRLIELNATWIRP